MEGLGGGLTMGLSPYVVVDVWEQHMSAVYLQGASGRSGWGAGGRGH